ncbi:uncharacterized protein LOC112046045 [Bicyclus anynana]|uniref:Uncharacterized protein LOC112046045 n=1 Tax=Bicyclus anynana TaxID=110368 RepID=A0A6J1MRJ3_BICAN|nr:uncharacterized protein LOC112046045 [Bicyclus anynana]XP_023938272.1 uncharacterized protein LOC112046045 [Bicyclus anynana]XP_023938273.1 uncharacterized protein LOC112046045 [Bicyclus anynana]
MASSPAESDSSEDEVFFGPITLKEVRACLLPKHVRRAMRKAEKKKKEINGHDNSIKIIEVHSEPEMNNDCVINSSDLPKVSNRLRNCSTSPFDSSYLRLPADDSFVLIEKQVTEICMTENKNSDLNNALDIDNYFGKKQNDLIPNIHIESEDGQSQLQQKSTSKFLKDGAATHIYENQTKKDDLDPSITNPPKNINVLKTPTRNNQAHSVRTPFSKNMYQHVSSPVAEYIKNPPVLIRRHGTPISISHIPIKKYPHNNKMSNKENRKLK